MPHDTPPMRLLCFEPAPHPAVCNAAVNRHLNFRRKSHGIALIPTHFCRDNQKFSYICIMKTPLPFLRFWLAACLCPLLFACHDIPEYADNPHGNFDALWTALDEHYCFFAYKDVDWDAIGEQYRRKIDNQMTDEELFKVCADMLKELKDGHTNLVSPFDISRYWVWEQYPQNYDERLVLEHYFNFDYRRASGINYGIFKNNIAYMHYGSFSSPVGEGNLDHILSSLALADGLIIDVRDNGGGLLTNVETLVGRFIDTPIPAGIITHKTGPGHDEFSSPYAYTMRPTAGRIHWNKPVVVVCNRATYSAANNFVSIMKSLPGVRVVGDVTGGGCGMPFTSELPNGWSVRFSAAPIYGPDGLLTEFGVSPSEGCKVDMDNADKARGVDTILERAFAVINEMNSSRPVSCNNLKQKGT